MRGDSRHVQSHPGRAGRRNRGGAGTPGERGASRPTAGPVEAEELAAVLEPVIAAAGLDLEAVRITRAGRRRLLRVVVDADGGIGLDEIAEVSRDVSAYLDRSQMMGEEPYTLEVSSPGVDRPLTQPRHWRRARGRLVAASRTAGNGERPQAVQGRVISASDYGVALEIDGQRHDFAYAELGPGRVQVEFGKLGDTAGEGGDGQAGARARPGNGGDPDGH